MKAYDTVNKKELDVDRKGLVDLMINNREVILVLPEKKTDEDGYLTWDLERWTTVDGRRFIRCYELEGRVLRDSTAHNIYDLVNDFAPEKAKEIKIG